MQIDVGAEMERVGEAVNVMEDVFEVLPHALVPVTVYVLFTAGLAETDAPDVTFNPVAGDQA